MQINARIFKLTFLFIVIAEILSFLCFSFPSTSPFVFAAISILAIYLTIKNLEYGIYLIFAELVVGSLGKMFVLEIYGFDITIRMVLWVVILLVWLAKAIKYKRADFLRSKFFIPYLIFAVVLALGTSIGIISGNNLPLIFSDVNNYLFFLLIFPIYEVIAPEKYSFDKIFSVIASSFLWLCIKTIFLFYVFSHELFSAQDALYAWSRNLRLAEITNIDPTVLTSRIFMQSQIWVVFGLFIFLAILSKLINDEIGSKKSIWFLLAGLCAIIMSFSRSFWLALGISFFVFIIALCFSDLIKIKKILYLIVSSFILIAISVALTLGIAAFPIPKGSSSSDLLKDRAKKFTGEAALSSRYAQIRPLLEAISPHPVFGSGFGTQVTYKSQDPRVLRNNPNGEYTTSAFELGWLEIWLKIGLLGVVAYLYILLKIFIKGFKIAKQNKNYFIFGSIAGLFAVIIIHAASPYLNHPLGIGIIMLSTALVDSKRS